MVKSLTKFLCDGCGFIHSEDFWTCPSCGSDTDEVISVKVDEDHKVLSRLTLNGWEKVDTVESELIGFQYHMRSTLEDLFNQLENGDYTEKFDLKLSLNDRTITLPLHADLYDKLESLIANEIKEMRE